MVTKERSIPGVSFTNGCITNHSKASNINPQWLYYAHGFCGPGIQSTIKIAWLCSMRSRASPGKVQMVRRDPNSWGLEKLGGFFIHVPGTLSISVWVVYQNIYASLQALALTIRQLSSERENAKTGVLGSRYSKRIRWQYHDLLWPSFRSHPASLPEDFVKAVIQGCPDSRLGHGPHFLIRELSKNLASWNFITAKIK